MLFGTIFVALCSLLTDGDVTYILLLPTIHCIYNGFFNKGTFKSTLRAEQSLQMLSIEIRKPALHIPPIRANQSPSI